jgi:chemotaxis protein CheC
MKNPLELTEIQRDALREIASIGISHSATALSKLINKKVMIDVPKVNILPINKLPDVIASSNELIVGIYFKILGKASGKVLLSFKKESALLLADILMKKPIGETKILTEMEQSALKELGAISTAVCLNALAEFLGMTLLPSIPHFMFDYSDSIVKSLFEEVKSDSEYLVVVDSVFKESNNKILGRFLIFPNEHSFEAIWRALKIKENNTNEKK